MKNLTNKIKERNFVKDLHEARIKYNGLSVDSRLDFFNDLISKEEYDVVIALAIDVKNYIFAAKSELQRGDLEKAIEYTRRSNRFNAALFRSKTDDEEIELVDILEYMGAEHHPEWEKEKTKLYKKAIENYGQYIESCKKNIIEEPKRIIEGYKEQIKGYETKISELKKEIKK